MVTIMLIWAHVGDGSSRGILVSHFQVKNIISDERRMAYCITKASVSLTKNDSRQRVIIICIALLRCQHTGQLISLSRPSCEGSLERFKVMIRLSGVGKVGCCSWPGGNKVSHPGATKRDSVRVRSDLTSLSLCLML